MAQAGGSAGGPPHDPGPADTDQGPPAADVPAAADQDGREDDYQDPEPPVGLTGAALTKRRKEILEHVSKLRKLYERPKATGHTIWADMSLNVRPANWHALQIFEVGRHEMHLWKELLVSKNVKIDSGRHVLLAKQMCIHKKL